MCIRDRYGESQLTTLTAAEARTVIAENPTLADNVSVAIVRAKVPGRKSGVVKRCAAHLYSTGFFDESLMNSDVGGVISDKELQVLRRRQAVRELQAVGILPSSLFGWVLAFAFRLMIERFLEALFAEYWN